MDDNNMTTLTEAQYEWALKLVHILQPLIYEGVTSIYQESLTICKQSDEEEKYLMTFQNFLSRIPKWNDEMIKREVARIVDKSGCTYLDDLITCVHIVHLKILTSIRAGKTQKKIDITIPKLSHFIHKVYVNLSRVLYSNVFLFEKDVAPLVLQKNRSEFNKMIRTAILDSIRESIPVEQLLRSYLDESTDLLKEETKREEEVKQETKVDAKVDAIVEEVKVEEIKVEEIKAEEIKEVKEKPKADGVLEIIDKPAPPRPGLTFSDLDHAITVENVTEVISAPKDVKRLEELSNQRYAERKAQDDDDSGKLSIGDAATVDLNIEVLS